MSAYDVADECGVTRGLIDALRLEHKGETGEKWLGWTLEEFDGLGEIEITTSDGGRYRVTVEPIVD